MNRFATRDWRLSIIWGKVGLHSCPVLPGGNPEEFKIPSSGSGVKSPLREKRKKKTNLFSLFNNLVPRVSLLPPLIPRLTPVGCLSARS